MIVQNAVTCLKCGDFIFSKHRHDFVTCSCGAISVDGGQAYLKRCGDLSAYKDESWEIEDRLYNHCVEAAQWGLDNGRNAYGIANAVLRQLKDKLT